MNNEPYTRWLQILAGLINPVMPGELREPLSRMLPHLRQEFSAQWLTVESAREVAEAERYGPCPDWGIIAKVLRAYASRNRPVTAGRIEQAPYVEPDDEAKANVRHIVAEYLAWQQSMRIPTPEPAKLPDVTLKDRKLLLARERAHG